jgi:hypothetical protein
MRQGEIDILVQQLTANPVKEIRLQLRESLDQSYKRSKTLLSLISDSILKRFY